MNITEKQLFNYIECPAMYDMKYNMKIPCSIEPLMNNLLDGITRYFFSNLLQGKVCSLDALKKKWDSICKANEECIDSKKNLEGFNYIYNFATWAYENKIALVDFDSTYTIYINDIELTLAMNPIIALGNNKFELLICRFSNKEPNQIDIDKRLKYTLDCYAFKKAYGKEISAIRVVHFKNKKEYTSYRTQTDFDRLETTIKNVANAIASDIYYPRENILCSSCNYKNYCNSWS